MGRSLLVGLLLCTGTAAATPIEWLGVVELAGGRGERGNVSRSPHTFSWLPRIAVSSADPRRVLVLWQEIIFSGGSHGGDILLARSENGGGRVFPPPPPPQSPPGPGERR